MISELLTTSASLGFIAILIKLVVDTLRKRRRDQAEGAIARGSVVPTLAERNLSVIDSQLVMLEKANAFERASYERRIEALEHEVADLTTERDKLQQSVATMREQVAGLQEQLDAVKAQLSNIPHPH